MRLTKEQIKNEAMNLDPAQRTELAEELLLSVDGPDRDAIDAAWLAEAHRRDSLQSTKKSSIKSVDDVIRRLENKTNP